jgi:hypothetical protein
MWAAAEGHSNLGIPKDVGEEFTRSDTAGKPELGDLSDHEAAEAIRDGELPSPTKYGAFHLFDLRITGTGAAYRDTIDEWAHRDASLWLNDEFVQRCNGLAVINGHPDGAGLNSEEFKERAIGSIVLPYIKGDEVWGIAKIFDDDAAVAMQSTHRSTSPGVTPPKGSIPLELNDGTKVLDEGLPLILDHLAICEAGVWDKDGPPLGIRLDEAVSRKDASVTAEEKAALEADIIAANRRADAAERRADAAEEKAAEVEAVADKAKADALIEGDKEALEASEKGKADKAKKDAREAFEAKNDGESDEDYEKRQDSRMDGESDEDYEDRKKDRKAKKDAALAGGTSPKTPVEADRGTAIVKDSKTVLELKAIVQAQGAQLAALTAQPTIDESNEMAKIWGRWDSLYQMLNEPAPRAYPGEKPRAYLRRCADGVRKHTVSFQNYAFHDSQQPIDFGLVTDQIFAEALAKAKAPAAYGTISDEREIVSVHHGKTRTEFQGGDPFLPFKHPRKFAVTAIVNPNRGNVYAG